MDANQYYWRNNNTREARTYTRRPHDGWIEAGFYGSWQDRETDGAMPALTRQKRFVWKIPDSVTVWDADWKNERTLALKRSWQWGKPHVRAAYKLNPGGGHNWYHTSRVDLWVQGEDGWVYHARLYTGGSNCTAKLYRTKTSWLWGGVRRIKFNARTGVYQGFNARGKRLTVCKVFPAIGTVYAPRVRDVRLCYFERLAQLAFNDAA